MRGAMGPAYCLRHRMLHFLQNFVYYMTLEVIGPRGHELEALLDKAEDLDEVMEFHEKFLDTCLKECLLASQDLLKILTKIMTTCLLFADQMQRFALDGNGAMSGTTPGTSTGAAGTGLGGLNSAALRTSLRGMGVKELAASQQLRQSRLKESAEFIQKESSHDSFVRILNKFGETFDAQVTFFVYTNAHEVCPRSDRVVLFIALLKCGALCVYLTIMLSCFILSIVSLLVLFCWFA